MSRRPVPQSVARARGEEALYVRFAYRWYITPIMRSFSPTRPNFANQYADPGVSFHGAGLRALLVETCATCDGEGFIGPRGTPCPDCSWARDVGQSPQKGPTPGDIR